MRIQWGYIEDTVGIQRGYSQEEEGVQNHYLFNVLFSIIIL